MIAIDLPWPPRALHPNARPHWGTKASKTKKARADGAKAALAARIRRNDQDIPQSLKVTAVFFPPNNRAHDVDGCMASCKAYFDGIADVIGIDDSKWTFGAPRKEAPVKGGAVRIELEAQ